MTSYIDFARQIRLRSLELCSAKKTSHLGGAFSVADILAVLYGGVLDISAADPRAVTRDRLFYSKGHACTVLYATLEAQGFLSEIDLLEEFTKDGSFFTSHVNHNVNGIELSTGSLGHALGVGAGSALAGKRRGLDWNVFVILSDGELDEGSNWEAILFAAHHRLDNLVAIVDYNKIQSFGEVSQVMGLEPLTDKFKAFGWEVAEVDGHSTSELESVLQGLKRSRRGHPKCVVAHTVKGKGVSFMENSLMWHYRSPSVADLAAARVELERG